MHQSHDRNTYIRLHKNFSTFYETVKIITVFTTTATDPCPKSLVFTTTTTEPYPESLQFSQQPPLNAVLSHYSFHNSRHWILSWIITVFTTPTTEPCPETLQFSQHPALNPVLNHYSFHLSRHWTLSWIF